MDLHILSILKLGHKSMACVELQNMIHGVT